MADQQAQRISCVVCEQPLPPKQYAGEQDPGYFPVVSTGYEAGDEPERNCEDIGHLLMHLQALNRSLWSTIRHMNLIEKVNRWEADTLDEREAYIKEARHLSFLFTDIKDEMERRAEQLRTWLQEEGKKQEAAR